MEMEAVIIVQIVNKYYINKYGFTMILLDKKNRLFYSVLIWSIYCHIKRKNSLNSRGREVKQLIIV